MNPFWLVLAFVALVAAFVLYRRLGRLAAAAALLAAAGLALLGSGLVDLPKPEDAVREIGTTLGAWTYLLVGVLAFLESAAFVGLVAPGEVAVILGGIVAGRGDIELPILIVVVWFAAVAGDLAGYAFGRRVGRGWALHHGARFGVTEERLARAERYFSAHGGKTIVVGRFVGLVRALTPFIAGTSRMPFGRFVFADVIGAGLWATTFCVVGYVFWRSLDRALRLVETGKLGLFGLVALGLIAFGTYRFLKHPEDRRRFVAWVRSVFGGRTRDAPRR
jgi:membrane protein DedA with SNARE-associated domain